MANLLTLAERKYLPDKRNLHVSVLSGDYYWFTYDNPVLRLTGIELRNGVSLGIPIKNHQWTSLWSYIEKFLTEDLKALPIKKIPTYLKQNNLTT
jgi:hypothetical protein